MMTAPSPAMEKMFAEWQIRGIIGRYARAVDRRDEALLRECFHAGALTHYGNFDGNVDSFVPWVMEYVQNYSRTMHFMGLSNIDWPTEECGCEAIVETYAATLHETEDSASGRSWVGGIRYLDRFECRPTLACTEPQWRIAERTVVGDWLRIDPTLNHRRFSKEMLTGQHGSSDPIFQLLSKAK